MARDDSAAGARGKPVIATSKDAGAATGAARRPSGELRRGWTTGACAAAATRAAYTALLTHRFPDPVTIRLPGGETPSFPLAERALEDDVAATAAVIKDAGDDPDVTHGALVRVTVRHGEPGTGVLFVAGPGVGVVTRPGLPVAVGEPAINPKPRQLMRGIINELACSLDDAGDVEVEIAIPGGEILAKRTANARLGIVGGLSILGTTGIVVPYSCASWIHSIHRGIDVARAAGLQHVAAATGSTSERTVQAFHDLPEMALLDMGDFAGGTLKYLRRHPIPRLTLAGGFAKLAKLADGHLDLHSSRSSVDLGSLVESLIGLGALPSVVDLAREAVSAGAVLALATDAGLPLADAIAARAREVALAQVAGEIGIEVLVVDRAGQVIGHARGW